jgi:hypothetical protein
MQMVVFREESGSGHSSKRIAQLGWKCRWNI